eukprot:5869016-Alexandrium_andersonii.AAC.2
MKKKDEKDPEKDEKKQGKKGSKFCRFRAGGRVVELGPRLPGLEFWDRANFDQKAKLTAQVPGPRMRTIM